MKIISGLAVTVLALAAAPARAQRHGWIYPANLDLAGATAVAWDPTGDDPSLLLAEHARILRLFPDGRMLVVAGTGEPGLDADHREAKTDRPADQTLLDGVAALVVLPDGSIAFTDRFNHLVRIVTRGGKVRTLAGSGDQGWNGDRPALETRFDEPTAMAPLPDGTLLVFDSGNRSCRAIRPDGMVVTRAGRRVEGFTAGGDHNRIRQSVTTADFSEACSLAVSAGGRIVVADGGRSCLRELTADGQVVRIAGSGEPWHPEDLGVVDYSRPCGQAAFTTDNELLYDDGRRIRQWFAEGDPALRAGNGLGPEYPRDELVPAQDCPLDWIQGIAPIPGGGLVLLDASSEVEGVKRLRFIGPEGDEGLAGLARIGLWLCRQVDAEHARRRLLDRSGGDGKSRIGLVREWQEANLKDLAAVRSLIAAERFQPRPPSLFEALRARELGTRTGADPEQARLLRVRKQIALAQLTLREDPEYAFPAVPLDAAQARFAQLEPLFRAAESKAAAARARRTEAKDRDGEPEFQFTFAQRSDSEDEPGDGDVAMAEAAPSAPSVQAAGSGPSASAAAAPERKAPVPAQAPASEGRRGTKRPRSESPGTPGTAGDKPPAKDARTA
jgi:hypothetical protein